MKLSSILNPTVYCSHCSRPRRWKILPDLRLHEMLLEDKWTCSQRCLQAEVERILSDYMSVDRKSNRRTARIPLGLALLERGIISAPQLAMAVKALREHGGRIGDHLRAIADVSDKAIALAIARQWSLPVVTFSARGTTGDALTLIPRSICERSHALPIYLDTQKNAVSIAFSSAVDHVLLNSIESLYRLRAEACIAIESELVARTASAELRCGPSFRMSDARAISGTIVSYATEIACTKISIARVQGGIWVELTGRTNMPLTFYWDATADKEQNDTADTFFTERKHSMRENVCVS